MASLEREVRGVYSELADEAGAPSVPHTVQGLVDLLGGGKEGRSALAKEIAAERGIKYESAHRSVERYTTEKGAEKRTPNKQMQDALDKIANRTATAQTGQSILDAARKAGGVTVDFSGWVKVSKDERYRQFSVKLSAEDLAPMVAQATGHHWKAAGDEFNYAVMSAWDGSRGGILSAQGVITEVDELSVGYGE